MKQHEVYALIKSVISNDPKMQSVIIDALNDGLKEHIEHINKKRFEAEQALMVLYGSKALSLTKLASDPFINYVYKNALANSDLIHGSPLAIELKEEIKEYAKQREMDFKHR